MTAVRYNQWRSETGPTAYPFADTASFTGSSGFVVNRAVFIDAALHFLSNDAVPYLARLAGQGATLAVDIAAGGETLSGSFATGSGDDTITLYTPAGRKAGLLVIDAVEIESELSRLQGLEITFSSDALPFVVEASGFAPVAGVNEIWAEGDTVPLSGSVWLVAGPGVFFSVSGQDIRLDFVGDPEWRRLLCQRAGIPVERVNYLQTIRGLSPDPYGNFGLVLSQTLDDPLVRLVSLPGDIGLELVCTKGGN